MLLKWVRCAVDDRAGFADGQLAWSGLAGVPGFVTQLGGWDADGTAHLLALWTDHERYDAFMARGHDALAAAQAAGITSTETRLLPEVAFIEDFAVGSGVLRVAYGRVKPDRLQHFMDAQANVWNPGMSTTPGFAGGVFGRSGLDFLVATRWASADAHAHYQAEVFPALRDRAAHGDDLDNLTGYQVELVDEWSVVT
jgi:heme-degrading monooxygenase HmoA